MTRRVGTRGGDRLAEQHRATRARTSPASRANQPVVSEVGACGSMPVRSRRPCVGPDAVQAAEARRHPHRAAGVGAERGVAEPLPPPPRPSPTRIRRARGPGARGLSGVPSKAFSPRMPSETSSVIVLPIRVAPASSRRLHRPGVTRRHRVPAGRPVVIAAAGRMPATSNRSLAAKVRPASGPPGAPAIRTAGPGTKGLVTATDTDAAARPPSSAARTVHWPTIMGWLLPGIPVTR